MKSPTPGPDPAIADVEAVARIGAVPKILDTIVHLTGMRFVAIARVTEASWMACAVHDAMAFGLQPGGELELGTTICNEVRQHRQPVVFGHASRHPVWADHPTTRRYGLESYISVPIHRGDGAFFGTLCAIDSRPADLENPGIVRTLELFADLIGMQLESEDRLRTSASALSTALDVARLRETFISVISQDFRAPIQAVLMDTYQIRERPELDVELRTRVRAIEANVWKMSALLDNIVDFSHRRLSGASPATSQPAHVVAHELERVVSQVAAQHPQRPLAASIVIDHPVDCDLPRLGQLLVILATHAIKSGDAAETVTVDAYTRDHTLQVSVLVGGRELGPTMLAQLFEPASALDHGSDRDAPGWDLFIAAEIARAHGGRLDANVDRRGTHLVFAMPCRADAVADPSALATQRSD